MRRISTRKAWIGTALGLASLAGCTASLRPPYLFDEIMIYNRTGVMLNEVRIRDVERDRVFECGNVAPQGICSDSFSPRPYRGNPIEISWSAGGETRQSQPFVARVPDFLDQARPVRGVLVIGEGAEAFFEQETKETDR